jgi:hypothetical protein
MFTGFYSNLPPINVVATCVLIFALLAFYIWTQYNSTQVAKTEIDGRTSGEEERSEEKDLICERKEQKEIKCLCRG